MTWRAMTRSPDCATLQSAHVSNVRLAESNSTPTTTVRGWPSPSPSPPSSNPIFQQSLSSLSVFCWFWFLVLGLVLFLLLFYFWVFGVVRERERDWKNKEHICIGNCEKWESFKNYGEWRKTVWVVDYVVRGERGAIIPCEPFSFDLSCVWPSFLLADLDRWIDWFFLFFEI